MIIDKNTVSEKDEFYEYPSILREYNDGLLLQKNDGFRHSIYIIGS